MSENRILVVATLNAHKLEEFRQIFQESLVGWKIESAADYVGAERWVENGTSFIENGRIKAHFVASFAPGRFVLADDSGLEVAALDGKPGVHSSSFGGVEGNHQLNNQRLLAEMRGVENRAARFVCQLCLLTPGKREYLYAGECKGRIIENPQGSGGFGYDPLFVPEGYNQSFAVLGGVIKNALSHRGRAFQLMLQDQSTWVTQS
jgi:XTP/dITP diphosphohydrolase